MDKTISFKHGRDLIFIPISNILLIKAENIYCTIHLVDSKTILVSNTMKELSSRLKLHPAFFKTHRSYIINLHYAERYIRSEPCIFLQSIDVAIPVSRTLKRPFESALLGKTEQPDKYR